MASIFTHPVVAIAFSPWVNSLHKRKVIFSGIILSIFPDIDVIAFYFGIPYAHMFGHRGITHSIVFALLFSGAVTWLISKSFRSAIWLYLFFCMVSHGILDALTNGGLGIAFFAPFSSERYFFPIQPIQVSTLHVRHFFSEHGITVMKSEFLYIWLPLLVFRGVNYFLCRIKKTTRTFP